MSPAEKQAFEELLKKVEELIAVENTDFIANLIERLKDELA